MSKKTGIKNTIHQHILNNSKEYTFIALIFLVGIFLGVMFVNNVSDTQISEVNSYINNFIEKLKNTEDLQSFKILKVTIIENILLAISIWFFGTTVIGIPVVFGIILYRGFCLGYTIASIIITMGLGKGIIFTIISLVLQNIILIPAIIAIAVSGFKLYKSIVKNKNKDNIKIEVLRHTIFSFIMLLLLCLSAVVEILISTNILKKFIKYF